MIVLRRQLGSATRAVAEDDFLRELHRLLQVWGLANRGARLAPLDRFQASIHRKAEHICRLERFTIAEPEATFASLVPHIIAIVRTLDINDNQAKVVAGCNALHHLLPDFILPIDRRYVGRFFAWSPYSFQQGQEEMLREALTVYNQVARSRHSARLIDEQWRTNPMKTLDNAIIEYCHVKRLVD